MTIVEIRKPLYVAFPFLCDVFYRMRRSFDEEFIQRTGNISQFAKNRADAPDVFLIQKRKKMTGRLKPLFEIFSATENLRFLPLR